MYSYYHRDTEVTEEEKKRVKERVIAKLDFIHFYETLKLTSKPLWDGCFTFSILSIISDMQKVFA